MDIQIIFHIPDDFTETVKSIGNFDEYANKVLFEDLQHKVEQQKPRKNKWQRMISDADELDVPSEIFAEIRKHSKEFREDFHFKHDLTE